METAYGTRLVAVRHEDSKITVEDVECADGTRVQRLTVTIKGVTGVFSGHEAWAIVGMMRSFSHLVGSGLR
jgi:hypothetical protein